MRRRWPRRPAPHSPWGGSRSGGAGDAGAQASRVGAVVLRSGQRCSKPCSSMYGRQDPVAVDPEVLRRLRPGHSRTQAGQRARCRRHARGHDRLSRRSTHSHATSGRPSAPASSSRRPAPPAGGVALAGEHARQPAHDAPPAAVGGRRQPAAATRPRAAASSSSGAARPRPRRRRLSSTPRCAQLVGQRPPREPAPGVPRLHPGRANASSSTRPTSANRSSTRSAGRRPAPARGRGQRRAVAAAVPPR